MTRKLACQVAAGFMVAITMAQGAWAQKTSEIFLNDESNLGCVTGSSGTVCQKAPWGRLHVPEMKVVSPGDGYACGIDLKGSVSCWGSLFVIDEIRPQTPALQTYSLPQKATGVVSTAENICVLLEGGTVECMGRGYGPLELLSSKTARPFIRIPLSEPVILLRGYNDVACAMTRSEKLWCWTVNDARDDLFLLGSDTVPLSPVLVSLGSLHIQDFQMNSPLFVLDPSGRLWEYGLTKETLFKPLHEQSPTHPVWLQIPIPERVAQIGVGNFAARARTVSGDVWCWGE